MANTALNQLNSDIPPTTLHKIGDNSSASSSNMYTMQKSMAMLFGMVILGGIVGFGLSYLTKPKNTETAQTQQAKEEKKNVAEKAGINDKERFKDSATGILREGGIEGEGDFHLERSGGASQNVYLTSTTVDLNEYIGKKITVWGETYSAEKAGWLMDAGYIEVVGE